MKTESVLRAWGLSLAVLVTWLMASGCFIVKAKQRDREREHSSTNLPPMEITTNLFRAPVVPGFGD